MALRTLAAKKTLGLALGGARPLAAARGVATFTLPDLPYDFGALEPAVSGEIMRLHHQKHHATYSAIKFNGGGHVNHSIFWKNLKPISEGGGEPPHGKLGWAIDEDFGSIEKLIKKMNAEGAALQGSGWVWLALDKEAKKLSVETTPNQDPLVTKGSNLYPLLGIDVWEHAYYLQYKNVRPDYLTNIWKVVNWKYAGEEYEKVLA
ncbi:unnamed protein product [Triticum turgidum subsp. durum]|uniref:Superoxide dismutase n=1 Tax=Triticum turgidum subsp. durum TaxID=4567 RepID=A0A9R1P7Q7_TRITD|nr:unnamed protein product [Triticum turgidum subsp. durum]